MTEELTVGQPVRVYSFQYSYDGTVKAVDRRHVQIEYAHVTEWFPREGRRQNGMFFRTQQQIEDVALREEALAVIEQHNLLAMPEALTSTLLKVADALTKERE